MGLFGKKKYAKNVSRDNEFLKNYAIKCNGLLMYVEDKENVKTELEKLKDEFQFAVATNESAAKKLEHKIEKDFQNLSALLKTPDFDENQAIMLIRELRGSIIEIKSLR